jgi:hypothetical protein
MEVCRSYINWTSLNRLQLIVAVTMQKERKIPEFWGSDENCKKYAKERFKKFQFRWHFFLNLYFILKYGAAGYSFDAISNSYCSKEQSAIIFYQDSPKSVKFDTYCPLVIFIEYVHKLIYKLGLHVCTISHVWYNLHNIRKLVVNNSTNCGWRVLSNKW